MYTVQSLERLIERLNEGEKQVRYCSANTRLKHWLEEKLKDAGINATVDGPNVTLDMKPGTYAYTITKVS